MTSRRALLHETDRNSDWPANVTSHGRALAVRRLLAVPKRALQGVADFLIPPACVACQTPLAAGDALCAPCWRRVRFITPPLCDQLGRPLPFDPGGPIVSAEALANPPDFDRARGVAEYAGVMRDLIHGFKYHDRHDPRVLFGRWLVAAGHELIADADLVLPVPLHRLRLLARRYNQSAMLAKEVGRLTGLPVHFHVLTRPKRTPQQVTLTAKQRLTNPRGAFHVAKRHRRLLEGRRVLLIDDVVTTGATVNACARTLRAAGAAQVDVLALALATGAPEDALATSEAEDSYF